MPFRQIGNQLNVSKNQVIDCYYEHLPEPDERAAVFQRELHNTQLEQAMVEIHNLMAKTVPPPEPDYGEYSGVARAQVYKTWVDGMYKYVDTLERLIARKESLIRTSIRLNSLESVKVDVEDKRALAQVKSLIEIAVRRVESDPRVLDQPNIRLLEPVEVELA